MTVELIHPWSGVVDYRYDYMDEAAIERTLQAAEAGFRDWSRLSLEARGDHLRAIAARLRERRETIAALMSADMGKLRREALAEIEKSASACEYYAAHAGDYLQDQPVASEARSSYVVYEPIGCVFAVMPWNFPIWQVFRFLAPALMAGNVAVLKHATNVPRCADAIAETLRDAGLPAGAFGVLHIDNGMAAKVIADPRIKAVTLTGSERAGRSVASNAGAHLKKCVMELGGSDPFVVLDDADLDLTVPAAIASRFGNAGQTCIAAKRFIVTPGIADAFVERFVEAARKLEVGDPTADATTLAPMARADLCTELFRQTRASIDAGAVERLGGAPGQGSAAAHYPATILRARDDEDAVRLANDTDFGLGASVWTRDAARGEAVARRLQAGATFVNAIVRSDVRLPFGGTKTSGFGRELAEHGIHEFMNIKTVYVA